MSSSEATNPILSSLTSTFRSTVPVNTRLLLTTTVRFLTARAAASNEDLFMFPLPTPAMMMMPLAPLATVASIKSAAMSS